VPQVYCVGHKAHKVRPPSTATNNHGFDDERGNAVTTSLLQYGLLGTASPKRGCAYAVRTCTRCMRAQMVQRCCSVVMRLGDYVIVPHDHVCYRFEIISILGKGSFGQVPPGAHVHARARARAHTQCVHTNCDLWTARPRSVQLVGDGLCSAD
jgi:hypothetical protein